MPEGLGDEVTATLLHPDFARAPGVELEGQLIGGVLALSAVMPNGTVQALGITGEEFTIEVFRKVWKHVLSELEQGFRPTHQTVASRGTAKRQLTPKDCDDLARLAETNTLTLEAFKLVAAQFKNLVVGLRTAAQLEQVAQRIRSRGLDAAREAGTLSGIERELHSQGARISDLTEDLQRVITRWNTNSASGKSDLVPTGITELDKHIGGLPKLLCLFTGAPGVGKTAFIDSMLHAMLLRNPELKIGLVGLEDGAEHVPERWLARQTGYLLREIGNRELKPEEAILVDEQAALQYPLLQRIEGYRERGINDDDLISLVWQMAGRGCGVVAIDNRNKVRVRLRGGEQPYQAEQRFSERLSEAFEKAKVVGCMILHLAAAKHGKPGGKPGLQGGEAFARDARFRIDFSRKGKALRGTIEKANKLCEEGLVLEFVRQASAGLIDPHDGGTINVEQERRIEKEQAEDETLLRQLRVEAKRKAKRDALKAEAEASKPKPVESDAQPRLLDVPAGGKP